jgi:hypothetical protein
MITLRIINTLLINLLETLIRIYIVQTCEHIKAILIPKQNFSSKSRSDKGFAAPGYSKKFSAMPVFQHVVARISPTVQSNNCQSEVQIADFMYNAIHGQRARL